MLSNVVTASCVVFFLPLTNGNNVVINEAAASAADRVLFSSVEALKGIFSVYSSSAMSNAALTFNTTYLRDMEKYPLALNESGENVNSEPGKCNGFTYRYKLIEGQRHYNEAYPVYIVQHNTVADFSRTVDIFVNGSVSAHYVIDKDGNIYEFVADVFRAYHAGVGSLARDSKLIFGSYSDMVNNMNSWSIGIENVNNGNEPYAQAQVEANVVLCQYLADKYPTVDVNKMIGHSDWSPGRKIDPNPYFPWAQLANAKNDSSFAHLNITRNFGIFPRKSELNLVANPKIAIAELPDGEKLTEKGTEAQEKLAKYGYDISNQDFGIYTNSTKQSILSFWLHFFGDEIVANETLKAEWNEIFAGRNERENLLYEFNENHLKCLDDVLEQFDSIKD